MEPHWVAVGSPTDHLGLVLVTELPTLPSSHLDLLCGVVDYGR
jgi:hypothetical protein